MGGFGSGQRWSKKGVVEGCLSIDTSYLRKSKLLIPGITEHAGLLLWRRGKEEKPAAAILYLLTVGPNVGTLQLLYAMKSTDGALTCALQLVTTPCHLGGVRWWFICPLSRNGVTCGRRVRKLYLCGKYFGCRHCHDLVYRSSQESDSRVYALARAGLDALPPMEGASVPQLGLSLKALTLMEKRHDRTGKRLGKIAGLISKEAVGES